MNDPRDRAVLGTLDTSLLVSWIERTAHSVWSAADRSVVIGAARHVWSNASANAGVTLLVAVAVHLLLMSFVRPAHGYWLSVPVCAGLAAAVLMTRARRFPGSRE
jgi:hypothetical protein